MEDTARVPNVLRYTYIYILFIFLIRSWTLLNSFLMITKWPERKRKEIKKEKEKKKSSWDRHASSLIFDTCLTIGVSSIRFHLIMLLFFSFFLMTLLLPKPSFENVWYEKLYIYVYVFFIAYSWAIVTYYYYTQQQRDKSKSNDWKCSVSVSNGFYTCRTKDSCVAKATAQQQLSTTTRARTYGPLLLVL